MLQGLSTPPGWIVVLLSWQPLWMSRIVRKNEIRKAGNYPAFFKLITYLFPFELLDIRVKFKNNDFRNECIPLSPDGITQNNCSFQPELGEFPLSAFAAMFSN